MSFKIVRIIEEYMDGTLETGEQPGGFAEGMFGVAYVTTESENYRNEEIITDEVIQAGRDAPIRLFPVKYI